MPLVIARRVLVSNRWWAMTFVGAFVALVAWSLRDLSRPAGAQLSPLGVHLVLWGCILLLLGLDTLWVGTSSVTWVLAPWRRTLHSNVLYYDGVLGEGVMAELIDGRRRFVFHHGVSFGGSKPVRRRRAETLAALLESERVAAGGNPHPARRHRPPRRLEEDNYW